MYIRQSCFINYEILIPIVNKEIENGIGIYYIQQMKVRVFHVTIYTIWHILKDIP